MFMRNFNRIWTEFCSSFHSEHMKKEEPSQSDLKTKKLWHVKTKMKEREKAFD